MFLGENLGDCITTSVSKTLYYLLPVLVMLGLAYSSSYTNSYESQRGYLILLTNFTLCNITLNLMLHNMAKKAFSVVQPALLYMIVPQVVFFFVNPEWETIITPISTALALANFYFDMGILCK